MAEFLMTTEIYCKVWKWNSVKISQQLVKL